MPIYEYQCVACGTNTDIKRGFKEPMNDVCPKCGGELKRLFNAAGIVFKGSGFYVTDSRKASAAAASAKSSTDKSADGKTSSDKTPGDAPAAEKSAAEKPSGEKSTVSSSDGAAKSGSGGKSDAAA